MLKRPCLSKTIFVMDKFFGSLNYYFGSFFSPVRFIHSLSVWMVRSYYSIDDFSTDLTLNCGLVRVDANDVVKMSWFKHWPNDTTFEFQKDGVNLYDVVQKCRPVGECTDKEGEPFITNKIWDYKMRNLQVRQVFSALQSNDWLHTSSSLTHAYKFDSTHFWQIVALGLVEHYLQFSVTKETI